MHHDYIVPDPCGTAWRPPGRHEAPRPVLRPLRFVINPASGGGAGRSLAFALERLAPGRSSDLCSLGLTISVCRAEQGALIVCGGDGSVAAALAAVLDAEAGGDAVVPVGMVPLGTGNDLARVCGWVRSGVSLESRLRALASAPRRWLDAWILDGPVGRRPFFAYCGLGHHAGIAAAFQSLRCRAPWLARGGLINKALYGACALAVEIRDLHRAILWPAGLPAPPRTANLIFCSIGSYAGGACLHPRIAPGDGLLDALVLPGPPHDGLALINARRPPSVQARSFAFALRLPTAMQCDGESFVAPPGAYRISWRGRASVLVAED